MIPWQSSWRSTLDKKGGETMATTLWGIHTKDDHLFLNSNVIAIGWKEFGDLKAVEPSREAFKEHYESVYENAKKEASEPAQACFSVSAMKCRLAITWFIRQRSTGR